MLFRSGLREKMMSNIEQVRTREGTVVVVGTVGDGELAEKAEDVIYVPETSPLLTRSSRISPLSTTP